jgi:hypothetical protein
MLVCSCPFVVSPRWGFFVFVLVNRGHSAHGYRYFVPRGLPIFAFIHPPGCTRSYRISSLRDYKVWLIGYNLHLAFTFYIGRSIFCLCQSSGLHPRFSYVVPRGLPLRMELLHFRLDVLHFTLSIPRVAPAVTVYRPFGTPTADGTFTFYILDWAFYMLPLSIPGLHPRLLYIVPSGLPLRMELLHFRLDVLHFTLAIPRVAPTVIVYRPFGTPSLR